MSRGRLYASVEDMLRDYRKSFVLLNARQIAFIVQTEPEIVQDDTLRLSHDNSAFRLGDGRVLHTMKDMSSGSIYPSEALIRKIQSRKARDDRRLVRNADAVLCAFLSTQPTIARKGHSVGALREMDRLVESRKVDLQQESIHDAVVILISRVIQHKLGGQLAARASSTKVKGQSQFVV